MSAVVSAQQLTKRFGDVVALDGVDLSVPEGQIHGIVGPNGAGKTTLFGLLLGLSVADQGTLSILDTDVGNALATPEGVAGFVDGPGLYPALTARQNLDALSRLRADTSADSGEALERVGLAEVADDKVRGFSLGMRQRLGLAAALLARPRLLVLDEPVNGLDPAGQRQVHEVLTGLATDGVTVLLSSHRMDDLETLCSEVTILATGRVVFSGPLSKLDNESRQLDYRLRTAKPDIARSLVAEAPDVELLDDTEPLVVRADTAALDELVLRLARAEVAVRELSPVVSPLEAAFLALTEQEETR